MASTMTADVAARWYTNEALAQIPRVLTLEDRDPSSPTYGCFDRNYWHYRTQDFPSGMYQELALPLAQVYALELPGNRWRHQPRLRELAVAGVRYAARSAHADGSCDDYYPFERALGCTAFAASTHAETLRLVDERDPELLAFLHRRARWLLGRQEAGRLANHQALVALAAARTAALTGDGALLEGARERLAVCLSYQHDEGWFAEYEGGDPGYQTLTIAFLAALRAYVISEALDDALARALAFAAHFLHPDGSYGGETGSRNTCQVLPSGFERLAGRFPEAMYLADGWLQGAAAGRRGYPDDDRIFSHWIHDVVDAYRFRVARDTGGTDEWRPRAGRTSFPAAGLHVVREGLLHLVISTGKGGVFRAYRGERLLRNDTGLVALTEDGRRLVSHMADPELVTTWDDDAVTVQGRLHYAQRDLPTPMKQVAFRLLNCTLGWAAPDLLRRLLQRRLITGNRPAPFTFERRIEWTPRGAIEVTDRITAERPAPPVVRVYRTTDATSIYVATSNLWQEASLAAWEELATAVGALRTGGTCEARARYE